MNKKRKIALFLAITISGLILAFMIKNWKTINYNSNNRTQNTADKDHQTKTDSSDDERVVLFLGMDQNKPTDSIEAKTRTDTIMLVKANFKTQKLLIISIPRDTRVQINGSEHKINAAHVYGGTPLVIKEVEKMFNTKVDSYVKFSFETVRQMVDQIGGVEVVLNSNLASELKKPIGMTRVNGDEALRLIRHRKSYTSGDYERIQVQQRFISSFVKEALKKENRNKLTELYQKSNKYFKTNIKTDELIDWIYLLKNMDPSKIQWKTLKGEAKYIQGVSYWLYDEAYVNELNREYFQHRK